MLPQPGPGSTCATGRTGRLSPPGFAKVPSTLVDSFSEPNWFGPYRLTSRLATGGMAEVYVGRHVAEDGAIGPMVAVKRLLPHLMKDQQVVRMFLNEARITSQINHPNVVRIVDLGQQNGEPFIAMELLEGRTFAEVREQAALDGKRVPLPVALQILAEACKGLHAAHHALDDQGQPLRLVHRDFTPDNVHVGFKGDIKVIDFGVARTQTWGAGTEPGTLKGKFFYMSPEMILAKPVDHRADVFAAGVMLYEQLTGHRPFTGSSVEEVVTAIAAGRPKSPRAYEPALPAALEAVALRALAHDPDQRFQSLAELENALRTIGGEVALASPQMVAHYVSNLFPLERDPMRQSLHKAREIDPSMPHGVLPSGLQSKVDALFAATAPPQQAPPESDTLSQPLLSEAATSPRPEPVTRDERLRPEPKRSRLPLVLGFLALAAVGGGAGVWWRAQHGVTGAGALEALRAAKDDAGKLKALEQLARAEDATAPQLGAGATAAVELKQSELALELAQRWQGKAPQDAASYVAEAKAATQARKGKRAEAALAKAATLAPDDGAVDVAEAELREAQGEASAAADAWGRAVKKKVKDARAIPHQGFWLAQAGRLDEAEQVLSKASRDPESAAELAGVKMRKGSTDEATALLRRALKESPNLAPAHYYLGAVLFAKGEVAQARGEYAKADTLAPQDHRALLALCQLEAREKSAAVDALKAQLTQRFPAQAKSLVAQCEAQ
ncbi:MAG: protein kinase [Myxococcaceae bacterium]|nr:protein kinase [Myxococcaceae bacterium]